MATTPPQGPGYPVTLRLSGRPCVVVGGGPVAERKAAGLVGAGARVTVVAPSMTDGIRALGVGVLERPVEADDLRGAFFVVTATGIASVDRWVHERCEAAGTLVNAADDPASCSAFLPAVLRRGPVTVAVSTDGRSPALAATLRDAVAEVVGPGVAEVAEALGAARGALHASGRSTEGLPWGQLARRLLAEQAGGASADALAAIAASWLAARGAPA